MSALCCNRRPGGPACGHFDAPAEHVSALSNSQPGRIGDAEASVSAAARCKTRGGRWAIDITQKVI